MSRRRRVLAHAIYLVPPPLRHAGGVQHAKPRGLLRDTNDNVQGGTVSQPKREPSTGWYRQCQ